MNRRDFFKLAGLGAGTLLLAPALMGAAWTEQWQAEDAVKFAVAHALAQGATYADARVGQGMLIGHHAASAPLDLLESDLLGMRVCTPDGWRMMVLRKADKATLAATLTAAIQAPAQSPAQRDYWMVAHFCQEKVLAQHASDSTVARDISMAQLRYGQRLALPKHTSDVHFCDFITQH